MGDYFFKQKIAEQYITEYIRNLPGANTDEEVLQFDSEQVLHSIEHHHGLVVARAKGIYSFCHLTFHEYFTAREFVVVRQSSEEALQNLVRHITEKRWREVFFLAVGMSPNADRLLLLIKNKIDESLASEQKLQHFLIWVREKSISVKFSYKLATVRAFYFSLSFFRALSISRVISLSRSLEIFLPLNFDFDLDFELCRPVNLSLDVDLSRSLSKILNPELKHLLQQLQEQLPDGKDWKISRKWWLYDMQAWREELRAVIIKHRNVGHDWQFSERQKELLNQYHNANLLLISFLNSDCYVSREVRQQIEDTLLLPIAEIKQRQQQS
ncbi:NACHT domain-containing protein [Nostoc sp.]|uniref:NACHT domain-containing protein n=1 Tax=Nostoc sp. TaxID=1180 RepID=UPI002FFC14D7